MTEEFNKLTATAVSSWEEGAELMGKLFEAAKPTAVYGEPVSAGEHTVITASEVSIGMGFGYGSGGGTETGEDGREGGGYGGGGGGGGGATGRPVAVISVGPQGVRVEPVVDPTKIAIAFFTTIMSMFLMLRKMRQRVKEG